MASKVVVRRRLQSIDDLQLWASADVPGSPAGSQLLWQRVL